MPVFIKIETMILAGLHYWLISPLLFKEETF